MKRRLFTLGATLAAVILLGFGGNPASANRSGLAESVGDEPVMVSPDPDTPVVLVILDELPTASLLTSGQTINARRFPNFAGLAAKSTWYRDHAAAGDFTAWAVPPILTGNHSNQGILPTNEAQPDNIFNLLGPDRKVHAVEEMTELCSKRFCPDGHQGEYPDETDALEFIKAKFKLVDIDAVNGWIGGIPAGERTFSVIHLPLPHQPQRFLPGGQTYPGGPLGFVVPKDRNDWALDDAGLSLVQQRHLIQTRYTDLLVGRIMKKIERNGDWDRSMVIVTADHGVSFDPRFDRRDVEPGNIAATVNPPLFIKYPGQKEGVVSERSTQAIDLVPTIAEWLGVDDLYPTDGMAIDRIPADRSLLISKRWMADITITADQIRAQRPGLIKASLRRLGSGGIWRLGPKAELIGVRPKRVTHLRRARARIDNPRRLERYRPGTGQVPSLISGTLRGVKANHVIALAVNGRITGTTRAFRYAGALRFGSMVSPAALRRGSNRVAVYRVGPASGRRGTR